MVYTDNLAQGLMRAATVPGAAGRVYWIADNRAYTMREIVDAIRNAMRDEGIAVSRREVRLPASIARLAGQVDRALQGLGRYSQQVHVLSEMSETIACTIDRARDELGYDPEIGLAEGMRRSLRWAMDSGLSV
jgi:nucleoside-diphosphate-sugar epimerase